MLIRLNIFDYETTGVNVNISSFLPDFATHFSQRSDVMTMESVLSSVCKKTALVYMFLFIITVVCFLIVSGWTKHKKIRFF